MPRLSRRLSSSARKAALAFRTRMNSLNLPGIRSGTLGRSWSWRSDATTSTASATSSSSSTDHGTSSTDSTPHHHVRNASVPLQHHYGNDRDHGEDDLRQHMRWASAPTAVSSTSTSSLDHMDGVGGGGSHGGDDSATVVDLVHHDVDAQIVTRPPHPTRPPPRPPTPRRIAVLPSAADDSAMSPFDIDSNMFASFTTVVGGESSSALSAAAEPHHAHQHQPNHSSHHDGHRPSRQTHHSSHASIPTLGPTSDSTASLAHNPRTNDSSIVAPSLVVGDAAAQHMFVPSTLSSFSDPHQPGNALLHDTHRHFLSPSDFDATLESTMIPGLDLATVSPLPHNNDDAVSNTSTVIRKFTTPPPPPLSQASSSAQVSIATHAQLPSSPVPTIPRRRSLSASTLDRIPPTFGRRSSSSTSSSSVRVRQSVVVPGKAPTHRASPVSTSSSSGAGTILGHGHVSPTGTVDTVRMSAAAPDLHNVPHGIACDYYESQLARLAYEYHEELARVQVERQALLLELARMRAEQQSTLGPISSDQGTPKPAPAALNKEHSLERGHKHGKSDDDDDDEDDVAANTTIGSLASESAVSSVRTVGTSGTAKKKRVSFDSETLLAQLEASQLARQRADNTIRKLQEQLDSVVAGSTVAQVQSEAAYFAVSPREFKMVRDSATDVEMLAHAVQARVRRFEADRGAGVVDETGSESESEAGEMGAQVKTRLAEEDKWERVVALVAHVVKGTEVIVREASAIFDWAALAGHPIASPEELDAWHKDRGIVLRVMRAAQSVVDAASVGIKTLPAAVGVEHQESARFPTVTTGADVAAAKTVAVGACVQLAGWVQLIESAVGDITESLHV
ncbi:hypothetical protein BCR44DRAFT_62195 [Catenaria anguillulae PL171]|uniref:Uncharacterized protein n=1 Tax=Catenaria anguillulae PL171 TaxID=765915 RepID=A0A1Y2HBN9_9FUNG|nr:hypothetical protein BCR44DRAFT_62195 [Catenaria anguillulae PL171]